MEADTIHRPGEVRVEKGQLLLAPGKADDRRYVDGVRFRVPTTRFASKR